MNNYSANEYSKIAHIFTCQFFRNKKNSFHTLHEALHHGYTPCKLCCAKIADVDESSSSICYCKKDEAIILRDLLEDTVPDIALSRRCCWKRICTVRGRHGTYNFNDETWRKLCKKRTLFRESPMGY